MKVFISGAAGFIGSHLSARFTDLGHEVVAFDNLLLGRKEFLEQQARKVADKINQAPEAIVGSVPSGTKEDLGKVIGKQGRTARAIRNLVQASAAQRGQRVSVQFVDA